jgi:hypothetical protein
MRTSVFFISFVVLVLSSLRILTNQGAFVRWPALCDAGLCDVEVLEKEARLQAIASDSAAGPRALAYYRALLRSDAASPYVWAHLAQFYSQSSDMEKAAWCAHRAETLGWRVAPALLDAVHARVAQSDKVAVLRSGRQVLTLVRDYDSFIFRYYDAEELPVPAILDGGIPPTLDAAGSWLMHVIERNDRQAAALTWAWMRGHSLTSPQLLNQYTAFLIGRGDLDGAAGEWNAFYSGTRPEGGNLLYNGGFERPLTGGPFDWNISPENGVQASIDRQVAHTGAASVRIDFPGAENVSFQGVSTSAVVYGSTVRLSVFFKSDGITTNEGVRVAVADAQRPDRFSFVSDPLTGSTDWRKLEYSFALPAQTRLLRISLVRRPSLKFDNKVAGTAWFDDFELTKTPR